METVTKTTNPEELSVSDALEKFQEEIKKIRPTLTDEQKDHDKQKEAKNILEQSVSFADNVIKRLVAHTIGRDTDDLFETCLKTRGAILLKENVNTKDDVLNEYTLNLDLVDHDYMLDLKQFKDHKGVKDRIIFLLNTVKVLYCPIKDHMKNWAKENDTTFNHVLQIGLNTTLFLDKDSKKRIGVILTRVSK